MSLSFYIARRYLFSKKKHNAINVISAISVCGVTLATLAMVCTLSVFNGFQELVQDMFTAFDPQLKILPQKGKVFDAGSDSIRSLATWPEIEVFSETLQENVLVKYKDRQAIAVLKGVQDNFEQLASIDSILFGSGKFMVTDGHFDYAVMGAGMVSVLGTGIQFVDGLQVFAPKRQGKVNLANPNSSFTSGYLFSPGVVFAVNQQEYDDQYILSSLSFVRKMLGYTSEVSAIELKLAPSVNEQQFQKKLRNWLGDDYLVLNRYEQQADVYRIMEIEKFISYLFLSFILLIACFNIVGSLSMLILDKKDDVVTLRNLGASEKLVLQIFWFEGALISFFGAIVGIVLGLLLCYLQQEYGLISFGNGSYLVSAYPVSVQVWDIFIIFVTVLLIGDLSVWSPIKYLTKRIVNRKLQSE